MPYYYPNNEYKNISETLVHELSHASDYGGYFIISGKEKVIVSQEKFGDNMLYVRKYKEDELYSYSCEVHSVSEDSSKPIRFTSVKMIGPGARYTNNQIVVDIPNVKIHNMYAMVDDEEYKIKKSRKPDI